MPLHAVGRGAQAKLLRGSKRAFFACVGEAGSAGSICKCTIGIPSHCPPPWGLWCFWGSYLLVAPPKKFTRYRAAKTAGTQVFQDEQNSRKPSPVCGQDTNVLAPSTPLAMLTHPGAFGAFFGMGCAWLRAAGGGCLRQGFDFRCARWCCHRQIGSEERSSSNLTKEQGKKGNSEEAVF